MKTRIIVLSDVHCANEPMRDPGLGDLGLVLLERATRRISRWIKPDYVVLLGDLIQNPSSPGTVDWMNGVVRIMKDLECPWFSIPGNHDVDEDEFYKYFARPPDFVDINDIRIVPFIDPEAPDWNATRLQPELDRMRAMRADFGGLIVAAQHVPLYPTGMGDGVNNYTNPEEILDVMREGGKWLTIAGHTHRGFDLFNVDDLSFAVTPSVARSPFRFMEVIIDGDKVETRIHTMRLPPELNLCDTHIHSQFAYCSRDSDIAQTTYIAETLGLGGFVHAEHSGQLYFDEPTYWKYEFLTNKSSSDRSNSRMPAYLAELERAGIPKWARGLEADLSFDGEPFVDPGDRDHMGFISGSVHKLPCQSKDEFTLAEAAPEFMTMVETAVQSDINVLTHPFRIFNRMEGYPPTHLFEPVVKLLKDSGVAAEINFHWQEAQPEFVEMCLNSGVKLALGSDAHWLWEIGELSRHLELLDSLGVPRSSYPDILFDPRRDSNT